MSSIEAFFEQPILNSPYRKPDRHWELVDGQPTGLALEGRRRSEFVTPVPKPQKTKKAKEAVQTELDLGSMADVDTADQKYDPFPIINEIRSAVDVWRNLPSPGQWQVTPETARLLDYWRNHDFQGVRPFFCQIEAVETLIWLTEVAPKLNKGSVGEKVWKHLKAANGEANPELLRIALKLATGTGKTTVMAMIIAWQAINAARRKNSTSFTNGFLIVTPGITIKDRLRVLLPNDPESYYRNRELVPVDLLPDLFKAKIVITNYHAFRLRDKWEVSKTTKQMLQGRGPELQTLETEGEMIRRVMPELMAFKNIFVLNDEAHHCYRGKQTEENELKGEEKEEAKKNNEAARLWISGLEAVKRQCGIRLVCDLSATPFFLRGSGYREGTLFHWTVSDFSLMDAIESGIVKLPRIPIADNVPGEEMPRYRNLWEHIGPQMPKKGRSKADSLDPMSLPVTLQTALDVLYGQYQKTYDEWMKAGIDVPPVFIVVANNTSASKLIYDYMAGFERIDSEGRKSFIQGKFELFRNYDADGNRIPRPNTLLIDSEQIESGDALDKDFKAFAADEIEQFRREIIERTGNREAADRISDQDLLREVMNTVGKKGRLGESIRCVVSVSMLTEGWDANTVTHILGVRAFGTQLLCEQVVGRALRRQSYDENEQGLFDVEYADILGIPFDFTAKPVIAPPASPKKTTLVQALSEREHLEIRFPRVTGYRVELPEAQLQAQFSPDSKLVLTPELVGPSRTLISGIVGEREELGLNHLEQIRPATVVLHLTKHLLYRQFRDPNEEPKLYLFGQLKHITQEWVNEYLECKGGTHPAQLLYQEIADIAAERIKIAITEAHKEETRLLASIDAYNPVGKTRHVNLKTTKSTLWTTDVRKSHINYVVFDSDWEAEFCRVVESHERVKAYVKNHGLGFEVPYQMGHRKKRYLPDFIVLLDDGREDPLQLVIEIKGFRGEDAKEKASTMRTYWIPGVNHLQQFGRWAFAELTDVYNIESDFARIVEESLATVPSGT